METQLSAVVFDRLVLGVRKDVGVRVVRTCTAGRKVRITLLNDLSFLLPLITKLSSSMKEKTEGLVPLISHPVPIQCHDSGKKTTIYRNRMRMIKMIFVISSGCMERNQL